MANKQELVHFLEQHVFNPILRAKPDDYSERDRAALEHVQKSTESERIVTTITAALTKSSSISSGISTPPPQRRSIRNSRG
jgi:hypothetical protein